MELDDKRLEAPVLELRPVRGRIPVLLAFLLGVLLIILISLYTHYGQSTRQQYVTWTRIAVQARSEATAGHLFLEESLMGSDDVTLEATWAHWDTAAGNISILIEGGDSGGSWVPPLAQTNCREQAQQIQAELDGLLDFARSRQAVGVPAGAGTAYDYEFDVTFKKLDGQIAKLVSCLRAEVDHHSQVFKVTQLVLTVILLLITAACLWLFAVYNRRIDGDIRTITATGEELNATNEELSSTIEELQATNEELEAQYAELEETHDNLQTVQRERLELQSRFSQIVDTSPMGLFFYELEDNGDLVLLKTNAATSKILGVDCSQMIGLTIEEAFPPLARTEIPDRYRAAARDGKTYYSEQVNYDDNVISGAYEIWAFQTEPMHMAVFFQDITERLRATEEVKALRQFLGDIIDSMPSALVTVDGQGKITQWNHSAEELTHRSAGEMVGTAFTESIPALAGESGPLSQVIHEREPYTRRKLQLAFNGESRLIDLTIYPLVHGDGAVIRLDDVTERVRMEEMMIQSEKMLSVGGLAAGMAHEINNPLAGILQNSQVLEQRLTKELPANAEAAAASGISIAQLMEYAERRGLIKVIAAIRDSGEHATQIVKNMLSFSRISDKSRSSVDLAQLVDETIELAWNDYDLKKNYDFRRISINREYGPGPLEISCERTKIQQVILNLLKNGAEAMVETQALRPPEFVIRLDRDQAGIRLVVEDNGPGITEEIRNRVFEPFFTTKAANGGTGLGLSISYFIITENHNGTMEVETMPQGGSRFTIMLPWEEQLD